jgi:hypothetical protein
MPTVRVRVVCVTQRFTPDPGVTGGWRVCDAGRLGSKLVPLPKPHRIVPNSAGSRWQVNSEHPQ